MQESWVLSTVTVHLKSGEQVVGASAALYLDAGGMPVVVQVSMSDYKVTIAWGDVVKIEHA